MVQLIKTDKAADRPEIKTRVILIPMSIQIRKMCVRVPGLGWPDLVWDAVAWGLNGSEFIKLRGDKRVATCTAEGFHAVR